MSYCKLILKKVYKNKLNFIPFLLILILISLIYFRYHDGAYTQMINPALSGIEAMDRIPKDIAYFQNIINTTDETSEKHQMAKRDLVRAESLLYNYEQRLDAFQTGDWNKYYTSDLKLNEIELEVLKVEPNYHDDDYTKIIELHIDYDQHMQDYNLGYDHRLYNIQGISYVTKICNEYLPVLLAILLIYITSSMYCSTYVDSMDKQKILPLSSLKRQNSRLLAGAIVGGFIVFLITGVSLISGMIGNTLGSLNSPVLCYTLEGADTFIPLITILPQFIIQLILSILFIVNFVSVLSIFIRRHMTCMLLSLVIIVGCVIFTVEFAPLQPYMHLLPTTYIRAFQVVSGELTSITHNANINLFNGILILGISNILLFLAYYYFPKSFRGRMMKE